MHQVESKIPVLNTEYQTVHQVESKIPVLNTEYQTVRQVESKIPVLNTEYQAVHQVESKIPVLNDEKQPVHQVTSIPILNAVPTVFFVLNPLPESTTNRPSATERSIEPCHSQFQPNISTVPDSGECKILR